MSEQTNHNQSHLAGVSFEKALERLGEVVRDLEEGDLTLDESVGRYEEGMHCLRRCQQMLSAAERRIEVLRGFDAHGQPLVHPLADDEMTLEEKADARSQRRTARPPAGEVTDEFHGDGRAPGKSRGAEPNDVDFPDTLF